MGSRWEEEPSSGRMQPSKCLEVSGEPPAPRALPARAPSVAGRSTGKERAVTPLPCP